MSNHYIGWYDSGTLYGKYISSLNLSNMFLYKTVWSVCNKCGDTISQIEKVCEPSEEGTWMTIKYPSEYVCEQCKTGHCGWNGQVRC